MPAGLALLLLVAGPPTLFQEWPGATRAWLAEHYTKAEHRIPMRDGARLHTTVYAPREATGPRPMVLVRTPYSCAPYGPDRFPELLDVPSGEFARDGYIIVLQDVRGTFLSEGEWVHMRPHVPERGEGTIDESTDAFDTIDWLVKNVPRNNGRVGLWGMSYPGFYVAASMIDPHPALRCAAPQATQSDWWYEDVHHQGAFALSLVFWFCAELGPPRREPTVELDPFEVVPGTRDGYRFFLEEVGPLKDAGERFFEGRSAIWNMAVEHPNRDTFWRDRDVRPHLGNVAPAVLNVGGWYDQSNLWGTLAVYRAIEERDPDAFNVLVMGPWEHTGWSDGDGRRHGDHDFGQATSLHYRRHLQKPFFDFYLLGEGVDGAGEVDLPEATVFETGTDRWRTFAEWPPSGREPLPLVPDAGGRLAVGATPPEAGSGFDSFVSDPSDPVPFTDETVLVKSRTFMSADQRFASRRSDVLTYRSAPLAEPFTAAGPVEAELWVSTDRRDADWVVKLIDEHPPDTGDEPGYQRLVRAEVLRGRFRGDPARAEPFRPGEPTLVRVPLPDVLHTFRPGHRVVVQVQSSWFPLFDRNPQSWVESIYEAEQEDFVRATHRVYRSTQHRSRVVIGVLR